MQIVPHRFLSDARRAVSAAVLLGTFLGLPSAAQAAPVVSPHLKVTVPSGGGLIDLFTFPKPDPCPALPCTDQRVMMAKFIVDDTVNDLSFELRSNVSIVKYPVTPFSTAGGGPNVSIPDNDTGAEAASVRARFVAESVKAGFRVVTILVRFNNNYDGFPVGETWKIQASPTPGDDHYYGFRVDGAIESAADALVTKPHLISYITDGQLTNFAAFVNLPNPVSINFGQVHINLADQYVPDEFYEFRNVGTGPFNITAASPAPALPFVVDNYPLPPLSVLPMDPFQRLVRFKPTAQGAAPAASVTLTTNAGARNLNLSGTGIVLNSAILLDVSGSMQQDKNGSWSAPADQQKIYAARIAALELSELYNLILPKARLGLYTYPDLAGSAASSQQLINLSVIDTNIPAYRNRLNVNLNSPDLVKASDGGTPMAEGIKRVWGVLNPRPVNTRAAVFHIGDGEHNQNSAAPRPTPADWYNAADFQNAGIPFFTIPYSPTGAGWLATFQQLANLSGTLPPLPGGKHGRTFPSDIMGDENLQTQFKKALGDALDLEKLKDPKANIAAGGTASHPVCVTTSTYQLVFSVHWTEKDANAVTVTIETPDHTMLTPASPAANPGHVDYVPGLTFADYVVRGKYLSGDTGVGVWRIHIKGGKATTYVYQVMAMDRMKTEATFDVSSIGRAATMKIKYLGGPHAVAGASITARYEKPSASFNNYLATTPVTPDLIARVTEKIGEKNMTLAEKKAYALAHYADKPFTAKRVVEEYRIGELERSVVNTIFPEDGQPTVRPEAHPAILALPVAKTARGEKLYQLDLQTPRFDGLHTLIVTTKGLTAREQCFERDYVFERIVDMALTPALMRTSVRWEPARPKPFFDPELVKRLSQPPPLGLSRMSVTFTPVDKAGNYWGVGRADDMRFALKDAQPLGRVMDNLDGSYTQVVEFKTEARPAASVVIGRITSGPIALTTLRPTPIRPPIGSTPGPLTPTPAPGPLTPAPRAPR
jgi:hypothetical protein